MSVPDLSQISFDHIQLYVNSISEIDGYLALQEKWNGFAANLDTLRKSPLQAPPYSSCNQDLVKQLLTGFGFRITGFHNGTTSRSILISSAPDQMGTQFLITAAHKGDAGNDPEHFQAKNVTEFLKFHNGRQGVGVLAFRLQDHGAVEELFNRYKKNHPKLLRSPSVFTQTNDDGSFFKYIETYSYYLDEAGTPDVGTVLRFVEKTGSFSTVTMPDITPQKSTFPVDISPSYNDHWVSNVLNRKQFLDTLNSVLGFTPKVDFNAGVVAAGEAIIESTVTGNATKAAPKNKEEALKDQSQIFLPINNAQSEVGHVHLFLQEIGQGVQHIASRVDDLVAFVERANEYRTLTGEGFSFLRIPRSYYGHLAAAELLKVGLSQAQADDVLKKLIDANLMDHGGIVKFDISDADLEGFDFPHKAEVIATIKQSRYINLYKLLRNRLDESMYLRVVKNQVLVDVQADDILYQIFTSNILQEQPNEEAPFLEFIQRTCQTTDSKGNHKALRAGCGGFGIRNFLTLFLSIEVTKAMNTLEVAVKEGNTRNAEMAKKMVAVFTHQLEVSNPILTCIADAMTDEGRAIEDLEVAKEEDRAAIQALVDEARKLKKKGQEDLMHVSDDHCKQMVQIRLEYAK